MKFLLNKDESVSTKMKTGRVTLKDIATRAGVRLDAASKVLNGTRSSTRISEIARQRIEEAATEMGYVPNALARALTRPDRNIDTIGVVIPPEVEEPLTDPFFGKVLQSIVSAATLRSLRVMLIPGQLWQGARSSLAHFNDGRCDGLLLLHPRVDVDMVSALLNANVPLVLLYDQLEDRRLACLDIDNFHIAYTIVRFLIELGHRRIALISEPELIKPGLELHFVPSRIAGYRQAIQDQEITPHADWINTDVLAYDIDSVRQAVKEMLDLPKEWRPTAFCCTTDRLAGIVIAELKNHGVSVPESISVTGMNDDGSAGIYAASLTTMRLPYTDIGHRAIALLQEQIGKTTLQATREIISTELVVRHSTAPPPNSG